jgi:N-carbamoylputrescine amidase
MTRHVTLAATQMACTWQLEDNLARAEALVREAAARGAQIVLPQELFATPYFCITQDPRNFELAYPVDESPVVARFCRLAGELGVVIPVSFFERASKAFFNSVAIADADGSLLGVYRKSHIPQAPGYEEKYYFSPGDTGFRVWETKHARLGVGICWDQWFPESARCMALQGAEILLYPTAIGSDPPEPDDDSRDRWQAAQVGNAVANSMPLVAANRVGLETPSAESSGSSRLLEASGASGLSASFSETPRPSAPGLRFYGSSFIVGPTGVLLAEASRDTEEVIAATVDLDQARRIRESWSFFRDRRPEHYRPLLALDGTS